MSAAQTRAAGGPVLRGDRSAAREAPPLGQILCERGVLADADLDRALAEQIAVGGRLGEVLTARGLAGPDDIAAALAEQWGLGAANLTHEPPDPTAGDPAALDVYLRHSIVPWRRIGKLDIFATSEPASAGAALGELGKPLALVTVAPRAAVDQALLDRFGRALADRAAERTPAQLSVRTMRRARLLTVLALAALAGALALSTDLALSGLALVLLLVSGATTATRLAALAASRRRARALPPPGTVALADRRPLPRISMLIPLYDEPRMVRPLVAALERIDYPRPLMDVKLLLEEDDAATRGAVTAAELPPWIEPLVLPPGAPRTKPRALNLALDFCAGEIVGILDAEDRPDPGQLQAVAEHLRAAASDVACVQCQLAWFNARESWITRCFQIEYGIWFDVLLRGFQGLGLPIPLGGTSVYFRRSALRDLDGWDAHNVTEDADLGMRLARRGLRTEVIGSTTEEEANLRIAPWIRQRSRWLKGYVLTWLVHMRAPRRLWRELGPVGFLGLNVLLLGGAVSYLLTPLFWIALVFTLIGGPSVHGDVLTGGALRALVATLWGGQAVMLGCAVLALRRRGELALLGWVAMLPLYWMLGAIAAWKAVFELVWAPYYWDKTQHGVTRMAPPQARRRRAAG
jgi:cellulose synthase/poly-beta-1,6-N-acetylglucosamine synthase-like glycosyltransferase